jgi:hypothetical protein
VVNFAFPAYNSEGIKAGNGGSFLENLIIGHFLCLLCPKRRRPLAGYYEPDAADGPGDRRSSADNHHGHNLRRWRQIEVRNRPKSLEGGQSESLKGHEGHYVRAKAYVYPETNSIHITEVKVPTPSETEKNDIK